MKRHHWFPRFGALFSLLLVGCMAFAQTPPAAAQQHQQRNFDARVRHNATFQVPPGIAQLQAVDQLRSSIPGLNVAFERTTGVTRSIKNATGFLSAPNPQGDPTGVALGFVNQNAELLGLTPGDIAGREVRDEVFTRLTGATRLYLRQICRGLPLYNGELQVTVDQQGRVAGVNNAFLKNCAAAVNTTQPSISASDAVSRAGEHLGIAATGPIQIVQSTGGVQQAVTLQAGSISKEPIEAVLMALPIRAGEARLVWNFQIHTLDGEHVYDFNVDAVSGEVWTRFDWVAGASYRVYPQPLESPNHASPVPPSDGRTLVGDPADATASPLGWHDTGSTNYTITRGNNVHSYEDRDGNNAPPAADVDCGGGLNCDFTINLASDPSNSIPAAVVNLFYWNNLIHDMQYAYGFDEANGNFQVNNFGNGGNGGDDVRAEAQDGANGPIANCNANFSTPPDGSRPRMQMYTCDMASPERDGDLDNGVIVHEYGHGISNRLVGGPGNVGCLANDQQPGEGLSDWWALAYTAEVGDAGTDKRGMGTYLFGEPATGDGIRPQPYSTDPAINDYTYETIGSGVSKPHGVGSVWAQAYWEVYWALVDAHGFGADLKPPADFLDSSAWKGNHRAMLYINEGLKNTACAPTFLDVRDGVIAAAASTFSGADVCLLWDAFAAFGLGVDATTGGPESLSATNGFETPLECQCAPGQTLPIADAGPDQLICSGDLTQIGTQGLAGHSYSWAPGGSTLAQPTVSPLASTLYTVTATTDCGSKQDSTMVFVDDGGSVGLDDDFEGGAGGWTATGLWNLANNSSCAVPGYSSATHAFYYGQSGSCDYSTGGVTKGELTSPQIFGITSGSVLSFDYYRVVESYAGGSFDTTEVQVLTNGGLTATTVWFRDSTDASTAAWLSSGPISLGSFDGQVIQIRFIFNSVDSVANNFTGWFVDDVVVTAESSCGPGDPTPNPPTLLNAVAAGLNQIDLSWDDNSDNEEGFRIRRCEGVGCTPAGSPIMELGPGVTAYSDMGLSADTTYGYSVTAYIGSNESAAATKEATTGSPPSNAACVDIVLQLQSAQKNRYAVATVTVDDCGGNLVETELVTAQWELPTGVNDPSPTSTNSSGVVVFESPLVAKKAGGSFTFYVLGVGSHTLEGVTSACINADGSSCNPGPPPDPDPSVIMTVQSVDVTLEHKGPNYNGNATVNVVEAAAAVGGPVSGATVECTWKFNGTDLGTQTGTTDSAGVAVIASPKVKASSGDSFTCLVTGVSKSGSDWDFVQESDSATVP